REGQARAVRRPGDRGVAAAIVEQLDGLAVLADRLDEDLAAGEPCDLVALGRDRWRAARADPARRAAGERGGPDLLRRRALGPAHDVDRTAALQAAAADVEDGLAGWIPGQVAQVGAVVAGVGGDRTGGIAAGAVRLGDPDVAGPAGVE